MKYELAKQLKDAGFPLREYDPNLPFKIGKDIVCTYFKIGRKEYLEPSLSELIEACGDRFDALIKDSEVRGDWVATAENGDADNLVSQTSSTPSEAVAKLWLTLYPLTQPDYK